MKKFRAWASTDASTSWEFEVSEDDIPTNPDEVRDFLIEEAHKHGGYVNLCHQCARHVDLGDFEIGDGPDDIEEIK